MRRSLLRFQLWRHIRRLPKQFMENHNSSVLIKCLDKLGASHTLMIGPTRSGKTTAMAITGIRTILNGDDAIYITNKPDQTTNYLAVAEFFNDVSQIINPGRQPDGTTGYNINPLEIIFNENIKFDPVSKFYEHVRVCKNYFLRQFDFQPPINPS
jgi:hypothetical protein